MSQRGFGSILFIGGIVIFSVLIMGGFLFIKNYQKDSSGNLKTQETPKLDNLTQRLARQSNLETSSISNLVSKSDECSKISNFVIKQKKIDDKPSCKEEEYNVGGKSVYFVDISYGPAQDCPAGCFRLNFTGIVDGTQIIEFRKYYNNISYDIKKVSGYECSVTFSQEYSLIKEGNEYKWQIFIKDNPYCFCKGYSYTY